MPPLFTRLRDAEVEDLDVLDAAVLGQEQVPRLDVVMDDLLDVGGGQALARLDDVIDRGSWH